jgi:hypothetical protein
MTGNHSWEEWFPGLGTDGSKEGMIQERDSKDLRERDCFGIRAVDYQNSLFFRRQGQK